MELFSDFDLNIDMNFNQLVALFEAKGTKPGERYQSAKNQVGPAGITSSPIGKDNYNPEMRDREEKHKDDKGDVGAGDVAATIKLLSKALPLLKNDVVFEDQMRGIMNGFKKNRHQISAYQESVLKSKPKTIDNQWGEINRLTKILNNPKYEEVTNKKVKGGFETSSKPMSSKLSNDREKFMTDLATVTAAKNENQAILDAVYDEVDGVTERNEELNNEYLEQLLTAVKHTTKRLFTQLSNEIREENGEPHKMQITMHELDWDMLEKRVSKDAQAQLQLLEMLMGSDNKNPLVRFMETHENRYNEARDRYYQLRRGDNYSITTDQLYNNLPLFQFVNFLSHAILKSPKIPLTTKQKKLVAGATSEEGMLGRLGAINNERQFDEIKPELMAYIDDLELDDTQKNALRQLANGKFVVRKGAPNAAFKIRSSLKSSQIEESFDDYAAKLLSKSRFDVDDYKLDMIELFS
jgi:hypothetical protein